MKKIILVSIFFFAFPSFMYLNAQWARAYGGSDNDAAYSIQQTSDGGYIVAGFVSSLGEQDFWVLKLSSTGTIDWQYVYEIGGSGQVIPFQIQQTSEGGYIVAVFTYLFGAGGSDFWVLKLSPTGTIEWQRTYGGSDDDDAYSIQQTSEGGYIVAGETWSFGLEGIIWVLKLSSTGTIEWQRTYGGTYGERAYSIQQTSEGGYIVAGVTWSFGAGGSDFWVLKLSPTGTIDWQHTYGGSGWDVARSIQQTSEGGYIVAGESDSFVAGYYDDIWVLKLSSTGTIEWQRTYGGSDNEKAWSIQQTSDGGYIVAGKTVSFGAGVDDAWILKLSSTGTIDWQRTYGRTGFDDIRSIQQTSEGGYIVAGKIYISPFHDDYDAWILKLFSDGEMDPSCGFIGTSTATVINTSVFPMDTNVTPEDTLIIPSDTSISPLTSDAIVTNICQEYILTISATTGGTTNPSPGNHTYGSWAEVSVQALPSSGYQFSSWSGDASGTTNPITITMDSDKSITANFTQIPSDDDGGDGDGVDGGDEDGKGGGCFIATAAFGSPLHPHVNTLRNFRDKYLLSSKLGREFIDFYYIYSPSVANMIARSKPLKVIVRIHLVPIIVLSYSMIHLGSIITGGVLLCFLVLPIFFIYVSRRR